MMVQEFLLLTIFIISVSSSIGLDNGAALTPPMGWSTWNAIRCDFNETTLLELGHIMVNSGMVDAGYKSLNIDDCWPLKERNSTTGEIVPDPKKFPDGMKSFADKLRKIGVDLGIYTSHGNLTCQKYPGSFGHEYQDATMYAEWGVVFVKNDWCSNRRGYPAVPDLKAFNTLRDALGNVSTSKHNMIYSIHWNYDNTAAPFCERGVSCPLGDTANMWRIGNDIQPIWSSILRLIDTDTPLAANAGPGSWNDADMLEVGNGQLTIDQNRAHFTMWCMLASPLVAGTDLRKMSDEILAILTNRHAIAVNQDRLGHEIYIIPWQNGKYCVGKQATLVGSPEPKPGPAPTTLANVQSSKSLIQVWKRPLSYPEGSFAVAFLNRDLPTGKAVNATIKWKDLGVADEVRFDILDLWNNASSVGIYHGNFGSTVLPSAASMYKFVPQHD